MVMQDDGVAKAVRALRGGYAEPILRLNYKRNTVDVTKRFHDLRHAHATHLLSSGVHPKVASERLRAFQSWHHARPLFARSSRNAGGRGRSR
jgi:integrase